MKRPDVAERQRARWGKLTPEERSAHNAKIARLPRSDKRCFCGQESMWVAANRYFDCCRRAGVITLDLKRKRELARKRRGAA